MQQFYYCSVCPNCFFHFSPSTSIVDSLVAFSPLAAWKESLFFMPASSLFSLCQYADTQIHLPHLHSLNLFYLCAISCSGCFPVSPHPYTANTMHTSFISPAFLHSQPPTASLFCHQILCCLFPHFTGFKVLLFPPPSDISKTPDSMKDDKLWPLPL